MTERKVFAEYFQTEYLNYLFERSGRAEESFVVCVKDYARDGVLIVRRNLA